MKIFDCFMYFDEELILELRLNILKNFVDYFVIIESRYAHNGKKRELKFNIEKFENSICKYTNSKYCLSYCEGEHFPL